MKLLYINNRLTEHYNIIQRNFVLSWGQIHIFRLVENLVDSVIYITKSNVANWQDSFKNERELELFHEHCRFANKLIDKIIDKKVKYFEIYIEILRKCNKHQFIENCKIYMKQYQDRRR